MYKYVLNSVAKISMMFAKYFEYYTIILRGAVFCGHTVYTLCLEKVPPLACYNFDTYEWILIFFWQ